MILRLTIWPSPATTQLGPKTQNRTPTEEASRLQKNTNRVDHNPTSYDALCARREDDYGIEFMCGRLTTTTPHIDDIYNTHPNTHTLGGEHGAATLAWNGHVLL